MVFNLLPTDLGRPIGDITHRLQHEGLISDAEQVLDSLRTVEREVQLDEREVQLDEREVQLDEREVQLDEREVPLDERGLRWFMVRLAPYRTADDRISGVVATFIDVTRRRQAEELVRVSEERYRTLFNSMDEGYYLGEMIFDDEQQPIDLCFLEANPAFERLTGWKDAKGRKLREFLPNIEQEWLDEYGRVAVTGEASRHEAAVAGLDGRWFDGYAFRVGGEGSRQVAVLFTETTARKQAEEQLRASEERFRTIADNVPQVIWTNDAKGDAVYFNRRFFEYTGLTEEELRGPGWQAVVHPQDAPAAIARWQQAFTKGEVFDAEYRLRAADGSYRWFLGRNVPLHTDGKVLSWFGSATDIHDFKEAQANLAETDEKFRLLVEGTPDYAMFLLDTENNITYWSAGAERVFQWTHEEALGKNGSMIFTPEDREKGEDQKELRQAMNDGSAPDRRWHVTKDGTRLWLDGFMRRLDHADGSLRGFAKIAREATEQKIAEEKLRHAYDELEQRVLERTADLMATNNELQRAIKGREQLERELLQISEREKRRIGEDLHDMICQELTATALFLKSSAKMVQAESAKAAQTLDESAQIVNHNVGFARDMARGLHPVELKASGLSAALRALATQTSETKSIACEFKANRAARISNDEVALHLFRVAQEAVTNAIKHSGAKNIVITLDRSPDGICLSVEDDGKGMPKGRRRRKGLGLHMMSYRANLLGGTFEIEPRSGSGTKVAVCVPAKKTAATKAK
jgi:PAS domain S-box-containing protein